MSKKIKIPDGFIKLKESKAICPHCDHNIPLEDIEEKYQKQDKPTLKVKCKCKRFIGITINMKGDFIAYSLKSRSSAITRSTF